MRQQLLAVRYLFVTRRTQRLCFFRPKAQADPCHGADISRQYLVGMSGCTGE